LFPDGLPLPRRYWAILAIILAIVVTVLDSTIVNVALPSIARDFGASAAASIWVVNAYQLAILMLLLPLASLGEIVGYRRVSDRHHRVHAGIDRLCTPAPSPWRARAIRGIGAGIMSVNAALCVSPIRSARSTRHWHQRLRGRHRRGRRSHHRRRHPRGRPLAVAVRHQRADRNLALCLALWPRRHRRSSRALNMSVLPMPGLGALPSGLQSWRTMPRPRWPWRRSPRAALGLA
jgi:hypothetical protein